MIGRRAQSWQVILADLALILFLTTLAGIVAARKADEVPDGPAALMAEPIGLFRPQAAVSLSDWLAQQQPDSRQQLTIFARYLESDRMEIWGQASALSIAAQEAGQSSRIVFESGDSNDVYVALAYDSATPQ